MFGSGLGAAGGSGVRVGFGGDALEEGRHRRVTVEQGLVHVDVDDLRAGVDLLAGDLNLTMWNDAYRPLVEVGGLHNARKGHGISPSWPALGPIGVPIDHILATRDVGLRNFRVMPGIGSDHYPVTAEFRTR